MFKEGNILIHEVGDMRIRIDAVDKTNLEYRVSPASSSTKGMFVASFSVINTWYKLCPQHKFKRDLEELLDV